MSMDGMIGLPGPEDSLFGGEGFVNMITPTNDPILETAPIEATDEESFFRLVNAHLARLALRGDTSSPTYLHWQTLYDMAVADLVNSRKK